MECSQPSQPLSGDIFETKPLLVKLPPATFVETLHSQAYFIVPARPNDGSVEFRLYYELHGHGPRRVVFISGIIMNLAAWEYQVRYFATRPEYQILIFDARGVGRSDTPPGFSTTKAMAHDTLALLDHLGWKADIHVVGFSLGGMVAQEMAIAGDLDRFASFAFTSTTMRRCCFPITTSYQFVRLALARSNSEKVQLSKGLVFPFFWLQQPCTDLGGNLRLVGRVHTNLDFIHESGRHLDAFTPINTFQELLGHLSAPMRHWVSPNQLQPLRDHPRVRCLILTGTDDRVIPCADSLLLATHLRAPTLVFPGSGHALALEQFSRFNAALDQHFNGGNVIAV
ncbi:hypothetical protein IWQ60_000006 [Tieghemiomyces parasiticus]|uniref:AB hydrolase-1 domain-containing protein n=1 Tax=Tieghemiomyces parasiticus TaxID=78921 RepID=A0A9W8AJN3_9FUNG|nr:hypothetical protein IWQ60_000006 [Tieghemiomyces parasiticus]